MLPQTHSSLLHQQGQPQRKQEHQQLTPHIPSTTRHAAALHSLPWEPVLTPPVVPAVPVPAPAPAAPPVVALVPPVAVVPDYDQQQNRRPGFRSSIGNSRGQVGSHSHARRCTFSTGLDDTPARPSLCPLPSPPPSTHPPLAAAAAVPALPAAAAPPLAAPLPAPAAAAAPAAARPPPLFLLCELPLFALPPPLPLSVLTNLPLLPALLSPGLPLLRFQRRRLLLLLLLQRRLEGSSRAGMASWCCDDWEVR